jgi:hypothetical protein
MFITTKVNKKKTIEDRFWDNQKNLQVIDYISKMEIQ